MESNKLTTPVLFLVFNRPESTQLVFEAIRKAKPASLYVAAEGPRPENHDDVAKCAAVRDIATRVDWECDVKTLFRNENLGTGIGISGAITWFFEHESEGIILEDDCLPSPHFFYYCTALLEKYRDDKRVMQIGGNNLGREQTPDQEHSYFFSRHNSTWGWATWKRAWVLYDYEMRQYGEIARKGSLNMLFNSIYEVDYFNSVFLRAYLHPHIAWDHQWEFIRRINSGLTILPATNLVAKVGFDGKPTPIARTVIASTKLPIVMDLPLRHPEYVMADAEADRKSFIAHLTNPFSRIKTAVKRLLPQFIRRWLFEASFKRNLIAHQRRGYDFKNSPNKRDHTDWSILKAITDKNVMRIFPLANLPLTMWGLDALIML